MCRLAHKSDSARGKIIYCIILCFVYVIILLHVYIGDLEVLLFN